MSDAEKLYSSIVNRLQGRNYAKVAETIGITRSYVQAIASGRETNPSYKILKGLDEALRGMTTRYFTHVNGFGDSTAYVSAEPSGATYLHFTDGTRRLINPLTLADCLDSVASGQWKEITQAEEGAEALTHGPSNAMLGHFYILRRIADAGKAEAEKKKYNVDIFIHLLDEIERAKLEYLKHETKKPSIISP